MNATSHVTSEDSLPKLRPMHPLAVRIMHWLNAVAMIILIMSGWQIYDDEVLFGWLHFPDWMTIGGEAQGALQWHFLGMWILTLNGLAYIIYGLVSGRFLRMLLPIRPREVVAEFAKHLHDELDLLREASNASQLRRNFRGSDLLSVPEIYWDWCYTEVMVMQRMHGTPISQVRSLRDQGIDIPKLSRMGVEIFFTQVFRDGFFHADMHPGNILVSPEGRYIALDFGIMGTLTDVDKNYLAQNFLAFFRRDYRRVAQAHVDAGWVPPGTRVDEFESAIRAVCEPIFDKPLKEISFGKVLLRLFQTARRFNLEVQPQLVLLQKTLLNIEGVGRELDPDLDLWKTAKPFLERWMSEQVGWRGWWRSAREEAPYWASAIPQLPRLVHRALSEPSPHELEAALRRMLQEQKRQTRWLTGLAALLAITAVLVGVLLSR